MRPARPVKCYYLIANGNYPFNKTISQRNCEFHNAPGPAARESKSKAIVDGTRSSKP